MLCMKQIRLTTNPNYRDGKMMIFKKKIVKNSGAEEDKDIHNYQG